MNKTCTFTLDALDKIVTPDLAACFAADHGLAVALCLIFAFAGAVFLSPSIIK